MSEVGKIRPILAFVLLLLWMSAPALRCLVPGDVLTAEEQACCKAMGGDCGNSTADHPCCKRIVSSAQPALAKAPTQLTVAAAIAAPVLPLLDTSTERGFDSSWLVDASPPPLENSNFILRI
jgi:hypothetical protein